MNIINKDSPELEKITLSNIKSYLNSLGWVENRDLQLLKAVSFKSPSDISGRSLEVRIPKNESYLDFYQSISATVNLLSAMYEKEANTIIEEISSCFTDILNTRVIDTGLFSNSLSLEEALREIGGIKSLLLYSASSEVKAKRHFDQPLSKGNKFIEGCRFGHTFKGSFGFTVEIPLQKINEEKDLFSLPFERRVCERIARGLKLLNSSLTSDDPGILINGYDVAFNSRMCDALINISNQTNKEVEIGFNWSKQVALSEDIRDFSSLRLTERHYEIASYASEKLKEVEPEKSVIKGRVVDLHCSSDPKNESVRRSIVLKHKDSSGELLDVKLFLSPAYYKKVCNAHSQGLEVSINGTLSRNKSGWFMDKVESVQV